MRSAICIIMLAAIPASALYLQGADGPAGNRPAPPKSEKTIEVTPEAEAEVFAFLNKYHPELAQVLSNLHGNLPREYDRAIRDLARVRERLSQLAERDPQRHELELQAWVVQSHIHLTVARLAMNDSPSLRDELRRLLEQQFELKLETMRHDRQRQEERLRKMDEQIEKLTSGRDEMIAKQLASLTRSSATMAERIRDKRERGKKGDDRQPRP